MIRELHKKLTIDSISIVIGNKYMNISEVPFPAVTIMSISLVDWIGSDRYVPVTEREKKIYLKPYYFELSIRQIPGTPYPRGIPEVILLVYPRPLDTLTYPLAVA